MSNIIIITISIIAGNVAGIIYRNWRKKKMPSKQSIATRKYEEKAGWMSKTYKLKREVVENFAKACNDAGVSQAGQLTKMMQEFIEQNK